MTLTFFYVISFPFLFCFERLYPFKFHASTKEQFLSFLFILGIKDDFQSVLRNLESLFAFLVLFHVRHHKMKTLRNYLHEVNQSFKTTAIMDAKQSKLYAPFFLISLDETTSQL